MPEEDLEQYLTLIVESALPDLSENQTKVTAKSIKLIGDFLVEKMERIVLMRRK